MRGDLRASYASGSNEIGRMRMKLPATKESQSLEWAESNGTFSRKLDPSILHKVACSLQSGYYAQEVDRVYPLEDKLVIRQSWEKKAIGPISRTSRVMPVNENT